MRYETGVGQNTALVAGCASDRGIGFATAKRFAKKGWAVAMLDLDAGAVSVKVSENAAYISRTTQNINGGSYIS